jgi:hypothetical protein
MEAIAHSEKFAKKVGVPMSVGKDFSKADKGRKFGTGGGVGITRGGQKQINKQVTRFGSTLGNEKNVPNINLNKFSGKKDGGIMKSVDTEKNPGLAKLPTAVRNKMGYMKKGGMADDSKEDMKMDKKQDVAMIKKAFREHDAQEHKGGKGTNLTLRKGGMAMKKMAMGGMAQGGMGPKTMSMDVEKGSNKLTKFGESAVQKRGHTRGMNLGDSGPTVSPKTIKMAKGGMCMGGKSTKKMATGGTASKRADGIASKGKTKGKMC